MPYNRVTSASCSRAPGIPQFFPNWAPLPSTFPLDGQFSWHLSASQYLLTGWDCLGIFQLSPTQCLGHEWVCPGCFTWAPQYLSYWEGTANLLYHQIKLRISTNMGDSRTRRDLPKLVCTPRGGRWEQGATSGAKALVPRGVQLKEEVHPGSLRGRHNCWLKKMYNLRVVS